MSNSRPTWVEVSLRQLQDNFRAIRDYVGPNISLCSVVKADAYGHGAVECARALQEAGASWFGVTSTEEGVQLRDAGITARILLMTGIWRGDEPEILQNNLTPAIWEDWHIGSLDRVHPKAGAKSSGTPLRVHLKVDSGMGRLGVRSQELPGLLRQLKAARNLELEGVFSHIATAEILDTPQSEYQVEAFQAACCAINASGFSPKLFHIANSAAIVSYHAAWKPGIHGNMARPGISLYGYMLPFIRNSQTVHPESPSVEPVLSWKTRIISLKKLPEGQSVGYNATFTTARDSRIAVLPVGYADGLNRQLSSRGRVIVRGQFAPIVGRVSMDLALIDVTDIPGVEIGDEAVLIGSIGHLSITAWEHAKLGSTIPYEVLCNISKRVPRQYVR